jgi:DNA-binding response OmpR family regulator
MKTVLLVEDDKDITRLNSSLFRGAGYHVLEAETVADAERVVKTERPDLIVLDIMLPDGSGLDFCRVIRTESAWPPILFLSAKTRPPEIVEGLTAGGDGYLPKPYDLDVLLANAEALLRRIEQVPETLTRGFLRLNLSSREAFVNERNLLLMPKEYALLQFFVQNENRVVKAEDVYVKVWGQSMGKDTQALVKTVSRLRKKLAGCGFTITMGYRNGYRFERVKPRKADACDSGKGTN